MKPEPIAPPTADAQKGLTIQVQSLQQKIIEQKAFIEDLESVIQEKQTQIEALKKEIHETQRKALIDTLNSIESCQHIHGYYQAGQKIRSAILAKLSQL